MAQTYRTVQGDMIDLICYRYYGSSEAGLVEAVLNANYRLSGQPAILPPGLQITLPDAPKRILKIRTVNLWD